MATASTSQLGSKQPMKLELASEDLLPNRSTTSNFNFINFIIVIVTINIIIIVTNNYKDIFNAINHL